VRKGRVQVIHIKPNRVRYLITPADVVEKSRAYRAYLESSLQFYRQMRDYILEQFSALSTDWPRNGSGHPKWITFYSAGEVDEIGHFCLFETDLQLFGVVDATRRKPSFGLSLRSPGHLDGSTLVGEAFDRLVVMSFGNKRSERKCRRAGCPIKRVFRL